jgi:hypothetical protein
LGQTDDVMDRGGEPVPVIQSRQFVVDWPSTEVTPDAVVFTVRIPRLLGAIVNLSARVRR